MHGRIKHFQPHPTIPGLDSEATRSIVHQFRQVADHLNGLEEEQHGHVSELKTSDCNAELGEVLRVCPPAGGMRVLLPATNVQNQSDEIEIAVTSVASGGSVTVVVTDGQPINDAPTLVLSTVGRTSFLSLGTVSEGWSAQTSGGGGGGASLAATLAIGNVTGGVDVNFTGGSELQMAGAPGVAGQVLTSAGPGLSPTWAAAGGGSDPRIFAWWGV